MKDLFPLSIICTLFSKCAEVCFLAKNFSDQREADQQMSSGSSSLAGGPCRPVRQVCGSLFSCQEFQRPTGSGPADVERQLVFGWRPLPPCSTSAWKSVFLPRISATNGKRTSTCRAAARLWLAALAALCPLSAQAQLQLGSGSTIVFATPDEGRQILTTRDDFVQRMSPFDRAARMKTDLDVSEERYLEFVGENILAWNETEIEKMTLAVQGIQDQLKALAVPFPSKVYVIKTTGNEEGGAAYTRSNAVVLPKSMLAAPIASLQKTICHELFHVMSRAHPDLREKLYPVIGFVKCGEVEFPANLKSRKITNPDAPRNDHCIQLRVGDKECWAVPILFSNVARYDTQRGGAFFRYLQFQLLLVEHPDNTETTDASRVDSEPKLVDVRQVSGFYEQVGRNTGYIIHPEEILADNFAFLVLRRSNLLLPRNCEEDGGDPERAKRRRPRGRRRSRPFVSHRVGGRRCTPAPIATRRISIRQDDVSRRIGKLSVSSDFDGGFAERPW